MSRTNLGDKVRAVPEHIRRRLTNGAPEGLPHTLTVTAVPKMCWYLYSCVPVPVCGCGRVLCTVSMMMTHIYSHVVCCMLTIPVRPASLNVGHRKNVTPVHSLIIHFYFHFHFHFHSLYSSTLSLNTQNESMFTQYLTTFQEQLHLPDKRNQDAGLTVEGLVAGMVQARAGVPPAAGSYR